jgi:hypothetical protein
MQVVSLGAAQYYTFKQDIKNQFPILDEDDRIALYRSISRRLVQKDCSIGFVKFAIDHPLEWLNDDEKRKIYAVLIKHATVKEMSKKSFAERRRRGNYERLSVWSKLKSIVS